MKQIATAIVGTCVLLAPAAAYVLLTWGLILGLAALEVTKWLVWPIGALWFCVLPSFYVWMFRGFPGLIRRDS